MLERFLAAIVRRAAGAYGGEFIGDVYEAIADLAADLVLWCADAGAFSYFEIRDRGDLVMLPPLIRPGYPFGAITADVWDAARSIMAGGTRRHWVRPTDLAVSGAAR